MLHGRSPVRASFTRVSILKISAFTRLIGKLAALGVEVAAELGC
jgi:hypothetical protein